MVIICEDGSSMYVCMYVCNDVSEIEGDQI